jgi:hypothetical protein
MLYTRLLFMRFVFVIILISTCWRVSAQEFPIEQVLQQAQEGGPLPQKLLASRSLVLHAFTLTEKEIATIHSELIRSGVDAVAYFELDRVFSGHDPQLKYLEYFKSREVSNLIFIQKNADRFVITIAAFTGTDSFIDPAKPVWRASNTSLKEALSEVYRTALSAFKKQNLLINDVPEAGLSLKVVTGNRIEAFAYDLKVDKLAVPKFADTVLNRELGNLMKLYPCKYELVDPTIPEEELRKKGFYYVMRFVEARGSVIRELLSYDMSKGESAYTSLTYPNGDVTLKTIPADVPVYKFYARKIDSGNVYLGNKWDADVTWQDALRNYIQSFKAELRL